MMTEKVNWEDWFPGWQKYYNGIEKNHNWNEWDLEFRFEKKQHKAIKCQVEVIEVE